MSRRALPVTVAAVALVLLPSPASAAPGQTPETRVGESFSAFTSVSLSDQRQVFASLSEVRNGPGGARQAAVSLAVSPGRFCWPTPCDEGTGYAFQEVDPEDLDVDRNLAGASVTELPVTLRRWTMTPGGGFEQVEEVVRLTLTFTGTGDVVRETTHPEVCGDGSGECRATQVNASREATADITVDDARGAGAGQLSSGRSVEAAIRFPADVTG